MSDRLHYQPLSTSPPAEDESTHSPSTARHFARQVSPHSPSTHSSSNSPYANGSVTPRTSRPHTHFLEQKLWQVPLPSPPPPQLHPPSPHQSHVHPPPHILPSFDNLDVRLSFAQRVKPWLPFILWAITSLAFLLAITVFRTELFRALDDLSHYLREEGAYGYAILFSCIFLTTFPPLPLYSTLIVLSGYTFGPWHGFLISYAAALTGAVVVYLLSRRFLYFYIQEVLNGTGWVKRVVRAIEKRPKLLFLIRVAPYPYNLLNAVLAVSPTLSFRTYFVCTALSLFKLIIHTSAGSTIKQFAEYHTSPKDGESEQSSLTRTWSIIGISLCVAIFLYLSYLARRAVQEETEEDEEAAMSEVRLPRGNSRTLS